MSGSARVRVVVVTGANEGIGHHLTRALLDDGYRVAGLDVATENLDDLHGAYPEQFRGYECDVTSDDDVERAVEAVVDEWGRIDILVNNAAIFEFGRFDEQSPDATHREFEVNFFGYQRTIRAVLPHMKAQGSGIVHNVSSGVGQVGHPSLSGYAATRGAIEAFTRSLRLELEPDGIACTLLYPPATNTRSAAVLDYPSYATSDPASVGRKLADKIESTDRTISADWQTKIGMSVARRFPSLVERGTERFV